MDVFWSYLLAFVGLAGFWLAGKKIWWAWYVNIANQALWVTYGIVTAQWGFLVGAGFYTVVFVQNAYKWTTEHNRRNERPKKFQVRRWNYPESTPSRLMRGPYQCDFCNAGDHDWCKDDCAAIDPYDWR